MRAYRLVLSENDQGGVYIYKDVTAEVVPRQGELVDVPELDYLTVRHVLHRIHPPLVEVTCSANSLHNLCSIMMDDTGWQLHPSHCTPNGIKAFDEGMATLRSEK